MTAQEINAAIAELIDRERARLCEQRETAEAAIDGILRGRDGYHRRDLAHYMLQRERVGWILDAGDLSIAASAHTHHHRAAFLLSAALRQRTR